TSNSRRGSSPLNCGEVSLYQKWGPEILLPGMLPGKAQRGESSWTPARYSPPTRTVLPEAKLVRAILVSIRGRSSGASATCVTKRSAPPQAPSFIGCIWPPRRGWLSLPCSPLGARAQGCCVQAMVAALEFDERTVADWWTRAGRQGQAVHEYLVEQPRDLGQVQADEILVKTQGRIVWMALAMMVKTRLWLGGEVSERRALPLIRRRIAPWRRCAGRRARVVV